PVNGRLDVGGRGFQRGKTAFWSLHRHSTSRPQGGEARVINVVQSDLAPNETQHRTEVYASYPRADDCDFLLLLIGQGDLSSRLLAPRAQSSFPQSAELRTLGCRRRHFLIAGHRRKHRTLAKRPSAMPVRLHRSLCMTNITVTQIVSPPCSARCGRA